MSNTVTLVTSTKVNGKYIGGIISQDNEKFALTKVVGKNISLGYWNTFSKEKLGVLIGELQTVYEAMEDSKNEEAVEGEPE